MIDRINLWTGAMIARIQREEGQAMVEYGLILALVSIAGLIALTAIGLRVDGVFKDIRDALPTP